MAKAVKKLFNEVVTSYDPQNRQVMICKGKNGFYVYKPHTGFTSRSFKSKDDEALLEILRYQVACMHNNAYYRDGDRDEEATTEPAANEATPAAPPAIPADQSEDQKASSSTVPAGEISGDQEPLS